MHPCVCRMIRPTISFHVERYVLMRDTMTSSQHVKSLSLIESIIAPTCTYFHQHPQKRLSVLASFPPPSPAAAPLHLALVMKNVPDALFPRLHHTSSHSSHQRVAPPRCIATRTAVQYHRFTIQPCGCLPMRAPCPAGHHRRHCSQQRGGARLG